MSGLSTSEGVVGVIRQWGVQAEGMCGNYGGGPRKLQLALEHPELKPRFYALLDTLAKERELMFPVLERGPRFVVQTGEFKDPNALIAALETAEVWMESGVPDLLRRISLQGKEAAESYRVTPGDLGKTKSTRRDTIYADADSLGFGQIIQEYPALVALRCARQLQKGEACDMEVGEWFVAASEPIVDSHGYLHLLDVGRDGDGVRLGWDGGFPAGGWSPDRQFLFRRK